MEPVNKMIIYQIKLYQYDDLIVDELFQTYGAAIKYAGSILDDLKNLDIETEIDKVKKAEYTENTYKQLEYLYFIHDMRSDENGLGDKPSELVKERILR
jgi:hypothetical protein